MTEVIVFAPDLMDRSRIAAALPHARFVRTVAELQSAPPESLVVVDLGRAGATLQTYLEARSAVVRMIDPAAMGRFGVIAFGAGSLSTADLPGLGAAAELDLVDPNRAPTTLTTD